jgi:hypothetical protein
MTLQDLLWMSFGVMVGIGFGILIAVVKGSYDVDESFDEDRQEEIDRELDELENDAEALPMECVVMWIAKDTNGEPRLKVMSFEDYQEAGSFADGLALLPDCALIRIFELIEEVDHDEELISTRIEVGLVTNKGDIIDNVLVHADV